MFAASICAVVYYSNLENRLRVNYTTFDVLLTSVWNVVTMQVEVYSSLSRAARMKTFYQESVQ